MDGVEKGKDPLLPPNVTTMPDTRQVAEWVFPFSVTATLITSRWFTHYIGSYVTVIRGGI